mgnify:CR=1 FL=1
MVYEVKWTAEAHEDLLDLFDYLIENVSAREAGRICSTVFDSTRYLSDFRVCTKKRHNTGVASGASV